MKISDNYPISDLNYLLSTTSLSGQDDLSAIVQQSINACQHGDMSKWLTAIESIKFFASPMCEIAETVNLGYSASHPEKLIPHLQQLMPWRKGPFTLGDVLIDTEWRSDWKWQRVAPHLSDMTGRTVLDVGCGNGYF